jgi:hypothetical protein
VWRTWESRPGGVPGASVCSRSARLRCEGFSSAAGP